MDEHAAFADRLLHIEDVRDQLRELCLRHEDPQYVDAMKRAFHSDANVLGASRGRCTYGAIGASDLTLH